VQSTDDAHAQDPARSPSIERADRLEAAQGGIGLENPARGSGVKKTELARRLNWHLMQVDRLLDLHHASRIDQVEAALSALDRRLEVRVAWEVSLAQGRPDPVHK
jgi:antitoxin HicB